MRIYRTSIIFCCVLAVALALPARSPDDSELTPDDRRRIIQEQERQWNLNPEDLPIRTIDVLRRETQVQVFDAELFRVLPGQTTELVLKSGTRITIPQGSFNVPAGSEVRAEVVELRKPRDFAFAGVPTNITLNGAPAILESAGMVRLRFLWNTTEAILTSSARLRLEMELSAYGSFNVYRREGSGEWELKGKAEERRANPDCAAQSGSECPALSTLIFDQIDRSGWWNFDEPKTEFTCITGTLSRPSADLRAVGVYRNWSSMGMLDSSQSTRFKINVMRNERAKVIAVEGKDKSAWLGTLPAFMTQDKITHTKYNNGKDCQEIGNVEMKPVPRKMLEDKESFLKAIQWEGQ